MPYRILVVDDNADAAEMLAILLQLKGHEVSIAADAQSALDLVQAAEHDAAYIDVGLPDIDGWELAVRIRATPRGAVMRLFALTGFSRPEDRAKSEQAGFDLHLVKPTVAEELYQALEFRRA